MEVEIFMFLGDSTFTMAVKSLFLRSTEVIMCNVFILDHKACRFLFSFLLRYLLYQAISRILMWPGLNAYGDIEL